MRRIYTYIIVAITLLHIAPATTAADRDTTRWNNIATDTTTVTRLLLLASQAEDKTPNALAELIGRELIGTPYKGGTLEGDEEVLTVNLDELDCTTFMETVAALSLTAGAGHYSWIDFINTLEQMRYRNGTPDGYASRLHYFSDWVITNAHRGLLKDASDRIPGCSSQIKTLDYMSRNRQAYPALSDSATYQRIKDAEVGFRSHKAAYIKSASLTSKAVAGALKGGDIVALTTKTPGLDVSHVGIIVIEKDGPHLLHASSKAGKVIIDPLTLAEYLKKNPNLTGIRVVRLQEQ